MVLTLVLPIQAHAFGNLLNDPQIGFGLSRRLNRLSAHLHHAIGVGHGTRFFWPGGSGQHHIGQPCRFCHENILNDQVL